VSPVPLHPPSASSAAARRAKGMAHGELCFPPCGPPLSPLLSLPLLPCLALPNRPTPAVARLLGGTAREEEDRDAAEAQGYGARGKEGRGGRRKDGVTCLNREAPPLPHLSPHPGCRR
jgi:hypothetical protein